MRRTYVRRRATAGLLATLLLLGVPTAAHALRDGTGAAPARDPRTVVDQIDARNGLAGTVIVAGQVLVVPATA